MVEGLKLQKGISHCLRCNRVLHYALQQCCTMIPLIHTDVHRNTIVSETEITTAKLDKATSVVFILKQYS